MTLQSGSRLGTYEISDVLASVLKSDPAWTAIPASTPASIRRLLRRCLEKDPRKRLSAIGDARLDLTEEDQDAAPIATPAPRARAAPNLTVGPPAGWCFRWRRSRPTSGR